VGANLHARWSAALASWTGGVAKRLAATSKKQPATAPTKRPASARAKRSVVAPAKQRDTAWPKQRAAAWARQCAITLERLLSLHRRQYLRHLRLEHGCEIEPVWVAPGASAPARDCAFVEPNLAPSPADWDTASPVSEVPEAWPERTHTIWDYVQATSLQGVSLAIVGPPGSGKTTLLKHATLALAAGWLDRIKIHAPDRLPVLLNLRDCAEAIVQSGDGENRRERASSLIDGSEQEIFLPQVIQDSLAKAQGPKIPERWFETRLRRGRCLVMLDGLGQVADPAARKQVARWVDNQMFVYPKTRFMIASRPLAYRNNPIGGGVTVLYVEPLTGDQVDRIVHSEYPESQGASHRVKDQEPARAGARAEDLLNHIWNTPALARLAVNPMHLTMIVSLHRAGRPLPSRRAELYAETLEMVLDKGQVERSKETLTPTRIQKALQSLAYHMMCQRQREVPWTQIEEAMDQIQTGTYPLPSAAHLKEALAGKGLLLKGNDGRHGFAHRTFQEYLAAAHAREKGLEGHLIRQVIDPWWVEAIRLYAAQTDASEIILACLAADPPAVPALALAIDCMQVTPGVRQPARERLEHVLEKGIEDDDPERRRIVSEVLLDRHLQALAPLGDERSADNRLITHAEYQLFLDEQRARGRYYQPDHWAGTQFSRGEGRMPAVGVRFSDARAFCEWLTQRSRGRWRYRLPEANELDPQDVTDSQPSLPAEIGYWTYLGGSGEYVGLSAQQSTMNSTELARWVSRDVKLAHDLILDHGRDWNIARDLDLSYELSLDPSRDLHLDLDLTRAFAHDPGHPRDLARDLDPDLEREYAHALALSYARDVALDRAHDHNGDLDPIHARSLEGVRDLTQALDLIKHRDLCHDPDLTWKQTMVLVRQSIRLDTLARVIGRDVLLQAHRRTLAGQPGSVGIDAKTDEIEHLERQLLDAYTDFCILEDRIEDRLPAVEGIRIVRERGERQVRGT
jgi:hypothetical protein